MVQIDKKRFATVSVQTSERKTQSIDKNVQTDESNPIFSNLNNIDDQSFLPIQTNQTEVFDEEKVFISEQNASNSEDAFNFVKELTKFKKNKRFIFFFYF